MKPFETVQVVRGEHTGKRAKIMGVEKFYFHVHLLTPSGRKAKNGKVSLHHGYLKPLENDEESQPADE